MIFDLKLDILYLRDCDDRVEAWPGSGLGWAGLGRRWEVSSICIFFLLCPEPRRQAGELLHTWGLVLVWAAATIFCNELAGERPPAAASFVEKQTIFVSD